MVAKKINQLAIVGPTASGKTALGIDLAKKYNGEIIATDSRTIYKYLDIGTAKPTKNEQADIKHWGLDLVGPGQKYSVAQFKEFANSTIKDILNRGKLPILVGGSGLYMDSVIYNYSFAPQNLSLRNNLEKLGNIELMEIINKRGLKMPENYKNKRYLVRTIERGNLTPQKNKINKDTLLIGINPPVSQLTNRIIKRAELMVGMGVVDEIKRAYKLYDENSEALSGGIYKSFKPFIDGKISQKDAIDNFVASDLRLVKKQTTWFKRNKDIIWYQSAQEAYKSIVSNRALG